MYKIFIFILLFSYNLFSQCDIENAYFSLTAEDEFFLRAVEITNHFEYAYIAYTLGEVTATNDSTHFKVKFLHQYVDNEFIDGRKSIQGMDGNGTDTVIANRAQTYLIRIPDNGKINFCRTLNTHLKCNVSDIEVENPNGENDIAPMDSDDIIYITGKNVISDDQEFVLEIIDPQTKESLQILDSVGIRQDSNVIWANGYGTEVKEIKRSVDVDSSLWGKLVQLRVRPKRFGPTPYGMTFKMIWCWVGRSAYLTTNYLGVPISIDSCYWNLHDVFYQKVNDYLDSMIALNGKIPNMNWSWEFKKQSYNEAFHNKYWEPVLDTTSGDTLYYKVRENFGAGYKIGEFDRELSHKDFSVISLYPNPVNSSNFTIEYVSNKEISDGEIYLMSIEGKKIATLHTGKFSPGSNKLQLQLNQHVANSSYMLMFYGNMDGTKTYLGAEKLIIKK